MILDPKDCSVKEISAQKENIDSLNLMDAFSEADLVSVLDLKEVKEKAIELLWTAGFDTDPVLNITLHAEPQFQWGISAEHKEKRNDYYVITMTPDGRLLDMKTHDHY